VEWLKGLPIMKKLFIALAIASGFLLSGCAGDYYGDYAGYGPGYNSPGYYSPGYNSPGYYGPAYYGPGYYGYYDAFNDPFAFNDFYGPGFGLYGGYYGGGGYGFRGGGFRGHGGGGFHGGGGGHHH
jgi:hypothetical protein